MTWGYRLARAWRALWTTTPHAEVLVLERCTETRVWLRGREHIRRYPVGGDAGLVLGIAEADRVARRAIGIVDRHRP